MYSDQAAFPKDVETITAAAADTTNIFADPTNSKKITHVIVAADAALSGSAVMRVTIQSVGGGRVYGIAALSTQQTTLVLPGFETDDNGLEAVNSHATVSATVSVYSLRP